MIKVIVGLGNPGSHYQKTRHNVGFLFLDHLVSLYSVNWSVSSQFQAEIADINCGGRQLVLIKPMTFMNKSGLSVGKVLRYYKLTPEELLVVHDEIELPEVVVKMKLGGGHAGHNGLRDIITHINSRDFYRLRIGVGRPLDGSGVAEYVLSNLSMEMMQKLKLIFGVLSANLEEIAIGEIDRFDRNYLADKKILT